jgi:hypothetical protein
MCAREFWRIEKFKVNCFSFFLVHISYSLSESCRMLILRLVLESCIGGDVSSDYWSEHTNTFIFKFKFLHLNRFLKPLREHFYMYSITLTRSRVCHLLVYSSTSHFPLFVSLMFSVLLLATMVCASLPLCIGVWQHWTHVCLEQRSHRNCAALVEGWRW